MNELFLDWQWQLKNTIKSIDELKAYLPIPKNREQEILEGGDLPDLPFAITPYVASLISDSEDCPIFSQLIPSALEHIPDPYSFRDPLGEEPRAVVPHLIHRYPDRVLFLATDRCASYCRFCTRKRMVGQGPSPRKEHQEEAFCYIEQHEEIKEIIFSGGDPLVLSTERLHQLFERAFSIKHINNIRIHTRMLSFAPMRIDSELIALFKKFAPIYVVSHFNHPKELGPLALKAIKDLVDNGIVMLNQSVLLKNINDNSQVLSELFRILVKNRCRPYYLHLCDMVVGARHFRVPIERALTIMKELRGHISGLCLPTLVIDIPGGHGKVPLVPNAIIDEDEDFVYLEGFKGGRAGYPKQ